MSSLRDAFDLIDTHRGVADFEGPQPDALIQRAEHALGTSVEGEYREFLARYGAGNFGAQEIYGVFRDTWVASPPEMVGTTLAARDQGLLDDMLVVYNGGDGSLLTLDQRDGVGEPPVTRIVLGFDPSAWERAYDRFGDFLVHVVRQGLDAN